ncbi:MAG TPA: glycosyltransferase family 2 protein [Polyangiaceae bacterium]|nr:glycosyltransferase family 2 protein [Polyangiaceae bacterium]
MIARLVSWVFAVPVSLADGYLLALTLLSGELRAPSYGPPSVRFAVVVPSHNEQEGIAATVSNLLAIEYPKELFSVVVVADNCSDETALRAERAGARVFVRHDDKLRGKGYALAHAFERLVPEVDAVVVVDADTVVSPNLLSAFAARIESGAKAVQADYAVRNPNAAWRTRLMAIAFGSFHVLRSLARERLELSAGLRGNGMCFTSALLREVPHDAYSIVEDVEYGIKVGEAGHRVHYAAEAHVYGEMVTSAAASTSQRRRWEGGRSALAGSRGLPLIAQAIARRSLVLLDLAFDVLVPPLSTLVMWNVAGLTYAVVVRYVFGQPVSAAIWIANLGAIGVYVLRGWSLSGTGARGLIDLGCAPFYVVWKMWLRARQNDEPSTWVRTAREAEAGTQTAP